MDEGRRSAVGSVFGCKEVDEADGDDAGWTDGRERPLMTAGPYALQRPKADSMVKPPVGCCPTSGAPGCREAGVLLTRLQTMSTRLERRLCTKTNMLF